MSETCDITTLAGSFKSYSELQMYCDQQFITLQKAAEKIKALETDNSHLKELLSSTTTLIAPSNEVQKIILTPEEALCLSQINILEERGRDKELTLEETKKLDLFIKNLHMIRGSQPKTIKAERPKSLLSNADLVTLAKAQEVKSE